MKIKEKYRDYIDFLNQIHISYKQYIGDRSLFLLHHCYLNGFGWAIDLWNQESNYFVEHVDMDRYCKYREMREFFAIFQRRMEEKYHCKLTQSWSNILRFYSDSEEDAFELFYREVDIFCEEEVPINPSNENQIYAPESCGNIRVLGEELELILFKKEQYNTRFYQELWKILIIIKKVPAMVIGEKALTPLNTFINGFACAFRLMDKNDAAYGMFPGFEEWVNQRARLYDYRPWHKVILFHSFSEENAFQLFYDYLQEYMGESIE